MTTNNLTYFIGKICTVFTVALNRNFKEENPATYPKNLFNYFIGKVESVDEHSIMLTTISGLKMLFFKQAIVAIAEEEVLDPDDADDAEIIEEFKKESKNAKEVKANSSAYIEPEKLSEMLKNIIP